MKNMKKTQRIVESFSVFNKLDEIKKDSSKNEEEIDYLSKLKKECGFVEYSTSRLKKNNTIVLVAPKVHKVFKNLDLSFFDKEGNVIDSKIEKHLDLLDTLTDAPSDKYNELSNKAPLGSNKLHNYLLKYKIVGNSNQVVKVHYGFMGKEFWQEVLGTVEKPEEGYKLIYDDYMKYKDKVDSPIVKLTKDINE